MPKYKANAFLLHDGQLLEPGDTVELTTEQAERLKDKVSAHFGEDVDEPDGKSLEDYTVAELREKAAEYEIDGYSTMKKDDLVEALQAHQ